MTMQYTPNYHLAYLDASTPLVQLADASQQVAQSLDAAMGRAGYTPPDATSFAAEVTARQNADTALSGRVTALEQAPSRVAPVGIGMNAPWVNFGGAFAGLRAWAEGRTGFLTGFIKPSAAVAAGDYAIAGLPASVRPSVGTVSAPTQQGRIDIGTNGTVVLSIGAVAANAFLIINMHWSLD